jgi:hypothetical protein
MWCAADIDQLFSRIVIALLGRCAHSIDVLMRIIRSCYHDSYGRTPVVELMNEVVNWSETFKDSIVQLVGIKSGKPRFPIFASMYST